MPFLQTRSLVSLAFLALFPIPHSLSLLLSCLFHRPLIPDTFTISFPVYHSAPAIPMLPFFSLLVPISPALRYTHKCHLIYFLRKKNRAWTWQEKPFETDLLVGEWEEVESGKTTPAEYTEKEIKTATTGQGEKLPRSHGPECSQGSYYGLDMVCLSHQISCWNLNPSVAVLGGRA